MDKNVFFIILNYALIQKNNRHRLLSLSQYTWTKYLEIVEKEINPIYNVIFKIPNAFAKAYAMLNFDKTTRENFTKLSFHKLVNTTLNYKENEMRKQTNAFEYYNRELTIVNKNILNMVLQDATLIANHISHCVWCDYPVPYFKERFLDFKLENNYHKFCCYDCYYSFMHLNYYYDYPPIQPAENFVKFKKVIPNNNKSEELIEHNDVKVINKKRYMKLFTPNNDCECKKCKIPRILMNCETCKTGVLNMLHTDHFYQHKELIPLLNINKTIDNNPDIYEFLGYEKDSSEGYKEMEFIESIFDLNRPGVFGINNYRDNILDYYQNYKNKKLKKLNKKYDNYHLPSFVDLVNDLHNIHHEISIDKKIKIISHKTKPTYTEHQIFNDNNNHHPFHAVFMFGN